MGTTTRYQLPYPNTSASVDIPRDVKALADKVDALKGIPPAIWSGIAFIHGDATISPHVFYTFPAGGFTAIPYVACSLQYFSSYSIGMNDMSVNGLTISIYSVDNTATSIGWDYPVHVLAIQQPVSGGLVLGTHAAPPDTSVPRVATCTTSGCFNNGIALDIRTPDLSTPVQCGVCEQLITDVVPA